MPTVLSRLLPQKCRQSCLFFLNYVGNPVPPLPQICRQILYADGLMALNALGICAPVSAATGFFAVYSYMSRHICVYVVSVRMELGGSYYD